MGSMKIPMNFITKIKAGIQLRYWSSGLFLYLTNAAVGWEG